jgi:hypothetical protein
MLMLATRLRLGVQIAVVLGMARYVATFVPPTVNHSRNLHTQAKQMLL